MLLHKDLMGIALGQGYPLLLIYMNKDDVVNVYF